ncbi:MAG: DUF2341 domain-containing protein [Sphaerochaetaceae bacterium]|nr:DUF2341 domain-containing protein [Sphaerochaetaceae bacterium]
MIISSPEKSTTSRSQHTNKGPHSGELDRAPRNWIVYGSVDGITWTIISIIENQVNWSAYEVRTFSVTDVCLEGHAQTSFGDLRFSTISDTPLRYCIDKVIGTTPFQFAFVDVNINNIATTDTTVKCWYGNAEAVSESSGENTYLLYDSFERTPIENESAVAYNYFKFDVTESNGTSYCEIQEIRFYNEKNELFSPSNMTSNNTPSPYVVEASSEYDNETRGWKAFSPGDVWHTIRTDPTPHLILYLGEDNAQKLYYWSFIGPGSIVSRAPKAVTIYGSIDGLSWTVVQSVSNQINWTASEERGFFVYENAQPPRGNWEVTSGLVHIQPVVKYTGLSALILPGEISNSSVNVPFSAASQQYAIQVYARKTNIAGDSYPIIHGDGSKQVLLYLDASENIKYKNAAGTATDTNINCNYNSWQVYEVNNLDFSAGTYDIYFNNWKIKAGAQMNTSTDSENKLSFYNSVVGLGANFWIDKLIVRSWLTVPPEWQGDGWSIEECISTGPTGIKTHNNILSANIKTWNGILWNTIKSIN